jgi:cell division protein FtsI (penicillin-binding protein 3)
MNEEGPEPAPRRRGISPRRIGIVIAGFAAIFLVIGGRLVQIGIVPDAQTVDRVAAEHSLSVRRPDVVGRDGRLLATDIRSASVFADPKQMIDGDEAANKLATVLPGLDAIRLRRKFAKDRGFVWIARELTPQQRDAVFRLGIPGIDFMNEDRRIYPNGDVVSHVLGAANVDGHGIAGIEKYIDKVGDIAKPGDHRPLKPVQMSIDLDVQQALRDELVKGMAHYKAIAAAGAVMDVNTGEVVGLISLPDFNPNDPASALKPDTIDRIAVGLYEMGSTFKALTLAMALDSGRVKLSDRFDASQPLHFGGFTIHDYEPMHRALNLPEIFKYSSNIGAARVAMFMGTDAQKAFLRKMGLLTRLKTELPESATPLLPNPWTELNTITIAFGHGIAVTPLQTLMAVNALVNGGKLITPTFLKRTPAEADAVAKQVISRHTSDDMRYLMRLNAEQGSARMAMKQTIGYGIGGKTGTANKVINGRYSRDKVLTDFTAIFPFWNPRYTVLVLYDEPKGLPSTHGFHTAAWNAGETAGKIIARIAPLLGVEPNPNVPPNTPPEGVNLAERHP